MADGAPQAPLSSLGSFCWLSRLPACLTGRVPALTAGLRPAEGLGLGRAHRLLPPSHPCQLWGFHATDGGRVLASFFFFWRGKIRAVGCLPRVLLPPRSNADPTTSDPNAFPASPPAAPWPWVWGVGWGWFWPCCFFCASCLGFRWQRCSAGAVGIFGQLCSLGQAPLFGAGWLWGNHNPPLERFRDYSGIPRAGFSCAKRGRDIPTVLPGIARAWG